MKWIFFVAILFFSSTLKAGDISVLLITGGKSFEEAAFFNLFDEMDGLTWKHVTQPDANQMILRRQLNDYDVLVFYDMYQEINEDEKAAWLKMTEDGKALLFLHHSLLSYQQWDEYRTIVGGKYYDEKRYKGTPPSGYSTYRHETKFLVQSAHDDHPVTRGLKSFELFDEVYGNFEVLPQVVPLLLTNHEASGKVIAWVHRYQNSPVIYLQPGHDGHAFSNEDYRLLLGRMIGWLAGTSY
ncbi:ThuA domain-containing protein [Roseimarinus sediminis]|jgi:hypothetical protein|uniref:ThuA domain-containing protein n=1 Tax=Roseimarinus sediminis TaxID=1610899 RepID=UPI003D2131D0